MRVPYTTLHCQFTADERVGLGPKVDTNVSTADQCKIEKTSTAVHPKPAMLKGRD